jgi:hypothetical protein
MPSPVTAFSLTQLLSESAHLREFASSLLAQGGSPSSDFKWDKLKLIALPTKPSSGSSLSEITMVSSGQRGEELHRVSVKIGVQSLPDEVRELIRVRCPAVLDSSAEGIAQSANLLTEVMPTCAGILVLTPSSIRNGNRDSFKKFALDLIDDPQQEGSSIAIEVSKLPEDLRSLLMKVHPTNWQANLFGQLSSNTDEIVFSSQIHECQLDGRWASLGSKVFIDEYKDSRFDRNNRIILLSVREPFEKELRTRTLGSVVAKLSHAVALRELVETVNSDKRLEPLVRDRTFREVYAASRQVDTLRELDRLVGLDISLDIDRDEIAFSLKQNPDLPQFPPLPELISRFRK